MILGSALPESEAGVARETAPGGFEQYFMQIRASQEERMATHSSILSREFHGQRGLAAVHGVAKSPSAANTFTLCIRSVLVAQSCWTLCDLVDCSSPGSSVHGML